MTAMIKKILFFVLAIPTAFSTFLQAEGLLGKRYLELSYQSGNITSDALEGDVDTWGAKARINIPLKTESETFEYDFFVNVQHAEIDETDIDADGDEIDFGLTFYTTTNKFQNFEFKPFLSLAGGYADGSLFDESDESFIYSATAGIEIPIDSAITITPYLRYVDIVEIDDGSDQIVGLDLSVWLNKHNSVGFQWEQIGKLGVTFNSYSFAYRLGF